MMKTLILSSLLLCCALPAVAQHDIYALNARGEVVSDSAFIDPFFWEDHDTPYEQIYTQALVTPGLNHSYRVKVYKYNGWDDEPGYYYIVDIERDGVLSLHMAQSLGWDKFTVDGNASDEFFKLIRLDEQTYILLFVGYHYASDPEQLTIVVLRNDKATLVFNKHWSIYNLRESPFLMKVVTQFPSTLPVTMRNTVYKTIFQEGNLLKWRQGKN